MSAPTLIGLTGKKRAGKDTAAARLVEAHGFTRFAFADIMKEFALRLDPHIPWPQTHDDALANEDTRLSQIVEAHGWEGAKKDPEVRRFLQALGTDAGRAVFGESFWIDRTFAQVVSFWKANGLDAPVVITDVRFPNEADAIRERGGIIVRVVRPGSATDDLHPSETSMDLEKVDAVLFNAHTVADLHAQVDALLV